jgi:hypothetical protein
VVRPVAGRLRAKDVRLESFKALEKALRVFCLEPGPLPDSETSLFTLVGLYDVAYLAKARRRRGAYRVRYASVLPERWLRIIAYPI